MKGKTSSIRSTRRRCSSTDYQHSVAFARRAPLDVLYSASVYRCVPCNSPMSSLMFPVGVIGFIRSFGGLVVLWLVCSVGSLACFCDMTEIMPHELVVASQARLRGVFNDAVPLLHRIML